MRNLLLVLGMVLLPAAVPAAEVRSLQLDREGQRYFLESESFIHAPVEFVYDVLTDYEQFGRVSKIFEESRFLDPEPDGTPLAYTKARGCIIFFCTTVERVERLELTPPSEIIATVIPERSNVQYGRAHWQLEPEGNGTRLLYNLEMEPGFWVPPVIGPWLIKRRLRDGGMRAAQRVENLAREVHLTDAGAQ